jgi:nicotinate (nicotinamide) nucleotide adenylyltransferase
MNGKNMVSAEHRLAMCELAAEVDGRIKVFDYEIKHQLAGETYQLVKRLLAEDFAKDRYDFSIVIGMDNANTFDRWVNYKDLERMMRFVIVPRSGYKMEPGVNWYLSPPHIYLASTDRSETDQKIMEVSSTEVRMLWTSSNIPSAEYVSKKLAKILDDKVRNYMRENKLYK